MVVPKYYYIDKNNVEAERANPGSQPRFASSEGEDGSLFLWGQSVYIISQLLGKLYRETIINDQSENRLAFSPDDFQNGSSHGHIFLAFKEDLSMRLCQLYLISAAPFHQDTHFSGETQPVDIISKLLGMHILHTIKGHMIGRILREGDIPRV